MVMIKGKRMKLNQIKSLNFEPDHFPTHFTSVSVNTGRKLWLHCEQTIRAYPPTITFLNIPEIF